MDSYDTPEPHEGSKNPLTGLGQRLKLHVVIPIVYAIALITVFVVRHT